MARRRFSVEYVISVDGLDSLTRHNKRQAFRLALRLSDRYHRKALVEMCFGKRGAWWVKREYDVWPSRTIIIDMSGVGPRRPAAS